MTSADHNRSSPTQDLSPLYQLIVARVKEFVRQPEAIFWSYGFPVLMVLALGIAFRNKPVTMTAVDVVSGPGASAVREALVRDKSFRVTVSKKDDARLRLRTARTDLVVLPTAVAPAEESIENEEPVQEEAASQTQGSDDSKTDNPGMLSLTSGRFEYHYLFDPTRSESALARLRVDDAIQRAAGRRDNVQFEEVPVQEPGSRYVDFLVPGLLGMNIMAGGLWGVGFAIVYMRIRKLLKRLVATPMKKRDFLTGVILSRLLFLVPGVVIILFFSWLVFGVAIQGRILDLIVLILVGAFTFSGIGMLVASRATTIEMVSGLMNLVMLPMWVFSGVFFSRERFPSELQFLIKALPLTPLIDGLRATMLEGMPLTATAQIIRLMWMLGWGLVTFGLALRWFRWT